MIRRETTDDRSISVRRLTVYRRESFHPSVPSIRLFFLHILSPVSVRAGSFISPLEASIQRLVRLSTDITNFTFHPFSASHDNRESTSAALKLITRSAISLSRLSFFPIRSDCTRFFPIRRRLHADRSGRSSSPRYLASGSAIRRYARGINIVGLRAASLKWSTE